MPDLSVRDIGEYGVDDALAAFDAFPWEDELRRMKQLAEKGEEVISPDMMFTVSRYDFSATVHKSPREINVELCVPKNVNIFGLFPLRTTKYFRFLKVSRFQMEGLLRAFISIPTDEQFAYFSAKKKA